MSGYGPNYVSSSETYVSNAYYSSGVWKYTANGPAYMFTADGATGELHIYTAVIGSAGTSITWNGPLITLIDAGAGQFVVVPASLKINSATATRPAKFDSNKVLISQLINLLSANDVVYGSTGFVTGAGGGAPVNLAFGITANPAFYGVQNGSYTFDQFVPITVATSSITYVDGVTPTNDTAVKTVNFGASSVTTGTFVASISVSTSSTSIVTGVTTSQCQVPALDGGHQSIKGLVNN